VIQPAGQVGSFLAKELYSVPDAEHIDLYDQVDKIPFDKLESFFKENM
jgi:fermentation-respiration switch protein FrsA (DUF1100 family)